MYEKDNSISYLTKAIENLSMKMDSKPVSVNYNDGNDVIMSYNSSYPVLPNIAPFSGNRIDALQFVETVLGISLKLATTMTNKRISSYQLTWDLSTTGMDSINLTVMETLVNLKKS